MGTYDKYRQNVLKEREFQREQTRLHEKHEEVAEDKVIIETSNTYKFTVKILIGLLKAAAAIVTVILISIGLLAIMYPEIRAELINTLNGILSEISAMFT